jgi:hypothetical protein
VSLENEWKIFVFEKESPGKDTKVLLLEKDLLEVQMSKESQRKNFSKDLFS